MNDKEIILDWLSQQPYLTKYEKMLFSYFSENHQWLQVRQPGRFTSIFWAIFVVVMLWFWHSYWASPLPNEISGFFNIPALRFKLFESGPIPYAILWTFFFGFFSILQIRYVKFVPIQWSNKIMMIINSNQPALA